MTLGREGVVVLTGRTVRRDRDDLMDPASQQMVAATSVRFELVEQCVALELAESMYACQGGVMNQINQLAIGGASAAADPSDQPSCPVGPVFTDSG